jgi:predicted nucleic acid-binding protein
MVAKRTLPKVPATGPRENISVNQHAKTGNIAVSDVRKSPITTTSSAQVVPQSVMVAESAVPFATTKALLVFMLGVFLALGVFSLQTETHVQGKNISQKWSFSTQQVSSLLSVLSSKKL